MPRAKSSVKQRQLSLDQAFPSRRIQKEDEWGGFVPLNVSEGEKEVFQQWWSDNPTEVRRVLDDALGAGLKFTLTFDGSNQCYIASLTGRPDPSGERAFTCCLSARGGTFEEAIAVLTFKHDHLLQTDWWALVNEPKRKYNTFG
jgi:hypothetical protein